jgi:hypothetical protein
MPWVVTIARSFGVSPLPLRLHVECLRSGVVRVEMPASLCRLRSLAERRVLAIMDANSVFHSGCSVGRIVTGTHRWTLLSGFSLQDLPRAKRTSG